MRNLVLFGVIATGLILLPCTIGVAQDEEEPNVLLREDFEGKEKRSRGKSSNVMPEAVTESLRDS